MMFVQVYVKGKPPLWITTKESLSILTHTVRSLGFHTVVELVKFKRSQNYSRQNIYKAGTVHKVFNMQ